MALVIEMRCHFGIKFETIKLLAILRFRSSEAIRNMTR